MAGIQRDAIELGNVGGVIRGRTGVVVAGIVGARAIILVDKELRVVVGNAHTEVDGYVHVNVGRIGIDDIGRRRRVWTYLFVFIDVVAGIPHVGIGKSSDDHSSSAVLAAFQPRTL